MEHPDIDKFSKKHDFLICIDSDGTAMDTMNIKHKKCFGPCFITEWDLDEYSDEVLKTWNEINLYKSTRGINRFKGLVEILNDTDNKYQPIQELDILKNWVETTDELSNRALKEEIERSNSLILSKALNWSTAVNQEIAKLTYEDKKPFNGVEECLESAYGNFDISVISSANMSSLLEEWGHYDLMHYIDVITSQEIGTKDECISKMMQKGYDTKHVLMIGDSLPDANAAKTNDVYFYPILPEHEEKCWTELKDFYLSELKSGNFEKHQEKLLQSFYNNFEK